MTLEARIEGMEALITDKLAIVEQRLNDLAEAIEATASEPMNVGQIAKCLGCHHITVQSYFRQGLLTNVGTPGRYMASRKEVARLRCQGIGQAKKQMMSGRELAHD